MSKAPVENCGVPGIHRGAVPPVNGRISQAGQVIKIAVICTAIQISRKKYAGQPICIGPQDRLERSGNRSGAVWDWDPDIVLFNAGRASRILLL